MIFRAVSCLLLLLPGLARTADGDLVHFGGSSWYPPFHYPASAPLVGDGFDVAVLDEIARRAGFRVTYHFGDWGGIQQSLASGELDVVPMFVSEQRAQRYLFSDPVTIEYHQLFGLDVGHSIRRVEDIAGLRVATETASLAGDMLEALGIRVTLLETASESAALRAAENGEADVALVPTRVALHAIATEGLGKLRALSPPLLPVTYSFAIRPGNEALLAAVNTQLAAMQRDGSLQELQDTWLSGRVVAAPEWPSWPFALLALVGVPLLVRRALRQRYARSSSAAAGPEQVMTEPDTEASELLEDLRVTLQEGGLNWLFQPQVSVVERCVVGGEMLVRWEHRERGAIAPDQFIGLAEHSGLIHHITRQAIDKARSVLGEWQRLGLDCSLSVNVSANDFADPAILEHIIEAMRGFEQRIILEITETAIMRDMQSILRAVDLLRSAGIRLSLDDYGTGYSSMSYLKEFHFDEIKIDRIFTRDILHDKRNLTLTRASAQLGRELGAQIVAEGVEDIDTARKLAELGCDLLQGYVFARPLSLEAFNQFVRKADILLPVQSLALASRSKTGMLRRWRA